MLEEYIGKRKKEDKIDEFDFKKHSENMASVIKYVTDYFNNYLNLEDYDYEQMRIQETINKFKDKVKKTYPKTGDYIISYYFNNKKRLDKYVKKAYEELKDSDLFYMEEDYENIAKCVIKNLGVSPKDELLYQLKIMASEFKRNSEYNEWPSISEMTGLDNTLVDWVKEVYKTYNVNLLIYASDISYHYYETYVDREYDGNEVYCINKYDYRYQENPFNINDIYKRNEHREFIKDHKGELEMLIMYFWLNEQIKDRDYWPEYVELCIATNRVKLAKSKRILIPVNMMCIDYPEEINSSISYIESYDGTIKNNPGSSYILRLSYIKDNDNMWKNNEILKSVIQNLQSTFKMYGEPLLIEFKSPYRTVEYDEEAFFKVYMKFEKQLHRFTNTKIAIINGCYKSFKGKEYIYASIDDISRLRNTCRELKLKLKLSVDFTEFSRKNILKDNMKDTIGKLAAFRSFLVGVHLDSVESWSGYRTIYENDKRYKYISIYDYPRVSTFLQELSTIFQDSVPRYFIPDKVKSSDDLEKLIDLLYRGGFSYKKGEKL